MSGKYIARKQAIIEAFTNREELLKYYNDDDMIIDAYLHECARLQKALNISDPIINTHNTMIVCIFGDSNYRREPEEVINEIYHFYARLCKGLDHITNY